MFLLHSVDRRTEIEALGLLSRFCFGEHVVPLWGRPLFTRFWLAGGGTSFIHVGILHVCSIQNIHLIKTVRSDCGRDTTFSGLLQTRRVRDGDQF